MNYKWKSHTSWVLLILQPALIMHILYARLHASTDGTLPGRAQIPTAFISSLRPVLNLWLWSKPVSSSPITAFVLLLDTEKAHTTYPWVDHHITPRTSALSRAEALVGGTEGIEHRMHKV